MRVEDGRSKCIFCKRASQYSEFIILIIEKKVYWKRFF
ncbi:hypothetical protein M087_3848 [Bacteroides fragilis str. S23 R14]|nr:hypothetical protein M087_3848 [Bacteroides fragilis str. S23 R14]EYA64554.1 hypothetical protein M139_4179 [Bacteroides fragilis str. S23L24]EYE41930.1 hypothetical protein M138_4113 [Bacteroides fragilis str. S23L17]